MRLVQIAFDLSPLPMLLVGRSGAIMLTNREAEAFFGVGPDALAGKQLLDLVYDTTSGIHRAVTNACLGASNVQADVTAHQLEALVGPGERVPVEFRLRSVKVEAQTCVALAIWDLTPWRHLEKRSAAFMDASATATVMSDENGVIAFANKAACKLFGFTDEPLVGKDIETLVPDRWSKGHPALRRRFLKASVERAMGRGQLLFARHREGHEIPVQVALIPLETEGGQMVMSTIVDLTERNAADKRMAEKVRETEALNAELSRYVHSASHDLKAPLVSIAGLMALSLEDIADGEIDEALHNIRRAAEICERSAAKVESVLAIARSGEKRDVREWFSTHELIDDIWNDLSTSHDPSPELFIELAHQDPVYLEKTTLAVILSTLISNALRFRDPAASSTQIRIVSRVLGKSLKICVADNGVGIEAHRLSKIFDMFERFHANSGDAVGLARAKKLVERLGGKISATSTPGVGTEFCFSIPFGEGNDE